MTATTFRVHPHRANFGANDLPKQYVHISDWGPEPRAFYEVVINPPCRTVYDPTGCGCSTHVAQAWMEGTVDLRDVTWTDRVITIGKLSTTTKRKR